MKTFTLWHSNKQIDMQTWLRLSDASESYTELLITVTLTLTGNDFMLNTVLQKPLSANSNATLVLQTRL